ILHVGVRGSAVEVEITLLDILAVVTLVARQPEDPLLQDRVAAVPHGDRKANVLVTVADAGDAVLIPAIGSGSRLIVRKVFPGVAIRAVVLADGAPRTLAQVRAPALPMRPLLPRAFQPDFFAGHINIFSPTCQQRPRWPRKAPAYF